MTRPRLYDELWALIEPLLAPAASRSTIAAHRHPDHAGSVDLVAARKRASRISCSRSQTPSACQPRSGRQLSTPVQSVPWARVKDGTQSHGSGRPATITTNTAARYTTPASPPKSPGAASLRQWPEQEPLCRRDHHLTAGPFLPTTHPLWTPRVYPWSVQENRLLHYLPANT